MKKRYALLCLLLCCALLTCAACSDKTEIIPEINGGPAKPEPPPTAEETAEIEAYDGPRGTDIPLEFVAGSEEERMETLLPEEAHRLLSLWLQPECHYPLKPGALCLPLLRRKNL